jgi:hypothetical protein
LLNKIVWLDLTTIYLRKTWYIAPSGGEKFWCCTYSSYIVAFKEYISLQSYCNSKKVQKIFTFRHFLLENYFIMQKILTCFGWSPEGLLWDHLPQNRIQKVGCTFKLREALAIIANESISSGHKYSHTNYGPYVFFHGHK